MQRVLKIKQIELKEANKFIYDYHRHHQPVINHRFSIGCFNDKQLLGVAIVGRPVSRVMQARNRIEITRLCTNGLTKNIASKLISTCARIAKEFGYDIIQTYILETESGISLKASGWIKETDCKGETLSKSKNRRRTDIIEDLFGTKKKYPEGQKQRWIKYLTKTIINT